MKDLSDYYRKRLLDADLTFQEMKVFDLSKEGMSCKDISRELVISYETTKRHRKNIIQKLGLSGKTAFRKFLFQYKEEETMLLLAG